MPGILFFDTEKIVMALKIEIKTAERNTKLCLRFRFFSKEEALFAIFYRGKQIFFRQWELQLLHPFPHFQQEP